jgi:hypothetical protein
MKPIYNTDIPVSLWLKRFSREQLRNIAKMRDIPRGQNKNDTAYNISHGRGSHGQPVSFEMDLFIHREKP